MPATGKPLPPPPIPQRTLVQAERASDNLRRLISVMWLIALVHLAHVVLISQATVVDASGALWRDQIVGGHAFMGVVALALWFALFIGGNQPHWRVSIARAGTALAVILYLVFGAWLASVDQLVTSNVTPLIVTAFGVALTVRTSIWVASIAYSAQLAVAVPLFLMGPGRAEAVASNVVNAVSIAALGWAVSRVLERRRVKELGQRLVIEEQTEKLENANRELERLAQTDGLTELLNRRAFLARGALALCASRESGKKSSVVVIDADQFKRINDTYGHPAGDQVLKMIAEVCMDLVRTDDLVARLGGEEFALLLFGAELEGAATLTENLRRRIAERDVWGGGSAGIRVTVSAGVAELRCERDDALEDAIRRADAALYEAKRAGRDRVQVASLEDADESEGRADGEG